MDDNIDSDLTNANGKSTTSNFTVLSGQSKPILGRIYPMATAGNLVWIDDNSDGLQSSWRTKGSQCTGRSFWFSKSKWVKTTQIKMVFINWILGKSSYYLKFNPPAGYGYTALICRMTPSTAMWTIPMVWIRPEPLAMSPRVNYVNIDVGLAFGALLSDGSRWKLKTKAIIM